MPAKAADGNIHLARAEQNASAMATPFSQSTVESPIRKRKRGTTILSGDSFKEPGGPQSLKKARNTPPLRIKKEHTPTEATPKVITETTEYVYSAL